MDYDFDFEVIRLKRLLEDSLVQAEKENMAILQSSNKTEQNASHSVSKNKKICPHIKSTLPHEEMSPLVDDREIHTRIHFLNSVQTSLLSAFSNRRTINDFKNKYTPCAIPLSPPVRLKRDTDESVTVPENVQNKSPMHPPFIHTCGKSPYKYSSENSAHVNACNKSYRNNKTLIVKNFPSLQVNENKENFTHSTEADHNSQVKDASFVFNVKKTPIKDDNFILNEKVDIPNAIKISKNIQNEDSAKESQIHKSKVTTENSKENKIEKDGFHLQISLDSCSANNAVRKMLNKLPEIVNKFQAASNSTKEFCSEKEKEEEFSDTIFMKPNQNQRLTRTSSSTQTTNMSFRNINEFSDISEKRNEVVSSSIQTDKIKEDFPIQKHELHCMVKEIVLDTLKSMNIYDNLFIPKVPLTIQKVDSGIQTEEETDPPEHTIVENFSQLENNMGARSDLYVSKDVQVNLNVSQNDSIQHTLDKGSAEIQNYSFEMHQEENLPSFNRKDNIMNVIPERSSTPNEKFNIESMLEKIYEQVCKEKETSKDFIDNHFNSSIYTRDVAVQFNPLHVSTKSTSTDEFKKIDSSCQYEVLTDSCLVKSYTDASVQVEDCATFSDPNLVQVANASTQCKQEHLSNAAIQTEAIVDSEHSTTNTSASTTPVSESMYMDDLLSEGEIALPWNLRLLSFSGGPASFNNVDSSDTSTKEKDYSLSEGEIHPNMVHYLNLCPCSHNANEDEDSKKSMCPTKFKADPKPGTSSSVHSDKHSLTSAYGKKLQLQMSSSYLSESEYNSSASLSAGEVSPSFFKVPLMDSTHIAENHPSSRSTSERIKFHSNSILEPGNSNIRDAANHLACFASSDNEAMNDQSNFKNSSSATLQPVDEEVHAIFE